MPSKRYLTPFLLLAACGGGGASEAPSSAPADVGAAEKLVATQRYAEALPMLQKAHESAPKDPRPLELMGLSLLELHRYDEAAAAFETLRALRPGDVRAEIGLARALEMQGRLDDATAALDRALAKEPDRAEALYAAGQLAARRNQDVRAKELLTRALAREPWGDSSASAHFALAGIAARAGDRDAAAHERALYEKKFDWSTRRNAMERRVAAQPNDGAARRALAALWREAENGKTAVAILEPMLRAHPRDAKLRVELAESRAVAGDRAGALAMDAEALKIDAGCVAAHRHRVTVLTDAGDFAEALKSLEAALDLDPTATTEPALREVSKRLEEKARAGAAADVATRAAEARARLGG